MRILLTGGGTGGHFYPTLAVIRALKRLAEEEKLFDMKLVYLSDDPMDARALKEEGVEFVRVPSGKMRRYFSLLNFTDIFKTIFGIAKAIRYIFWKMPDVVFVKGGYASFPALIATRIFRIPIMVHESDAVPGRANRWAGSFARRIAISFPESAKFFDRRKTALVGNPVRRTVLGGNSEEAGAVFGYEKLPTVLILGGSLGAVKLNNVTVDILPELLKEARVIHQSGRVNFDGVSKRTSVVLQENELKDRYRLFPFLNESTLRSAAFISTLIVSRAGAGAIFEIAAWGKPSILVPIKNSAQDHQRENAYAYARATGAAVIEEANLTPHILLAEIRKLLRDEHKLEKLRYSAKSFAKTGAAEALARQIITLALEHAR